MACSVYLTNDDIDQLTANVDLDETDFISNLPAELRGMIVKHVLRTQYTLRESNGHEQLYFPPTFTAAITEYLHHHSFNTALLRIRGEAYELFYSSNTFRIECTDDLEFGISLPANAKPFITHLELREEPESVLLSLAQTTTALLSICPRLKSVTIGYDQYAKSTTTITDTLRSAGLIDSSAWIDVGHLGLELQGLPVAVSLKHFGLSKAWTRHERNRRRVEGHVNSIFRNGGANGEWKIIRSALYDRALSLQVFLTLHNGWRAFQQYPNFTIGAPQHLRDAGRLAKAFDRNLRNTASVPKHQYELNDLRLGDIDATQHSQDLVRWVSELLVMNKVAFDVIDGYGEAENANERHRGDRKSRRDKRRVEGGGRRVGGTGRTHTWPPRRQRGAAVSLVSPVAATAAGIATIQSFAYSGVGQRLGW
ncbi:hypothetical protein LTR10_007531 [Elasticomyces elasticus]|nr:hypothetical protein LTR10_007531 [Elasticomyces elasticus]